MTDQNLIRKIAEGDEPVFDKLFKQYYPKLVVVSLHLVKRQDIAEEIVQNLFTELWLRKKTINIEHSLQAYLKKACIFRSIDFLRSEGRKKEKEDNFKLVDKTNSSFSPEEILLQEERVKAIYNEIEALPEPCKRVFKMSRYDSMSYSEIATKLSISTKAVEYHISKALRILRTNLFSLVFLLPILSQ